MFILNFIKSFDIFTTCIPLSYQNQIRYRTIFGGIFSIIIIITTIIIVSILLSEFYKNKPFTIITEQSTDFKEKIDFSHLPFLFAVYGADSGRSIQLDDKLFKLDAKIRSTVPKYINGLRYTSTYETPLEIINCNDLNQTNSSYLKDFQTFNLTNFLCIVPGQNLSLYGKYADIRNGYNGFRLYLQKCNNDNCYNDSYIESILEGASISFSYMQAVVDNSKTKDNIRYEIFTVLDPISLKSSKTHFHQITKGYYKVDVGFLFTSYDKSEYFSMTESIQEINPIIEKDYIGFAEIDSSGTINTIVKQPESFITILGTIGGFFNAIFTAMDIFINFFSDKKVLFDIVNHFIGEYKPNSNGSKFGKGIRVSILQNMNKIYNNKNDCSKEFFKDEGLIGNSQLMILNNKKSENKKEKNNIQPMSVKSMTIYSANKSEKNKFQNNQNAEEEKIPSKDSLKENQNIFSISSENMKEHLEVSQALKKAKTFKEQFLLLLCPLKGIERFNSKKPLKIVIKAYFKIISVDNLYLSHLLRNHYKENFSGKNKNIKAA